MSLTNIILPDEVQGAGGYMAVKCASEKNIWDKFSEELRQVDLRLLDVENIEEFVSISQVAEIDEHLSKNIENWQAGKATVWGTIHMYLADGEA